MTLNLTMYSDSMPFANFTGLRTMSNEANETGGPTGELYDAESDPFAEEDFYYRINSILLPTIFGIISIIGILGNSLVILVTLVEKKMRNSTNVFILNLSIADLSFIIICVPLTAYTRVGGDWIFGEAMCKIVNYFTYVNVYASIYTILLMSLDRFFAIAYPIRSLDVNQNKSKIAAMVVLCKWTVVLSLLLPLLFKFETTQFVEVLPGENITYVTCREILGLKEKRIFFALFFVTSYVLPLFVISLAYCFLVRALWRSSRIAMGEHVSDSSLKKKKKVIALVLSVVIVFAVCWLPFHVIAILLYFSDDPLSLQNESVFKIFLSIANCLSYANSCINPILYTFMSKNYRNYFQKIMCCRLADESNQRITKDLYSRSIASANNSAGTRKRSNNNVYFDVHPERTSFRGTRSTAV